MFIIDVSDPATPTLASYINLSHYPCGIDVCGNYAYVATYDRLSIIDISDPNNPQIISECSSDGYALAVCIKDNYAYVTGDNLNVIDISDPLNPSLMGTCSLSDGSGFHDIEIRERYAYVVSGYRLWVVDISRPTAPKIVYTYDTPYQAYGIDLCGRYIYYSRSQFTADTFRKSQNCSLSRFCSGWRRYVVEGIGFGGTETVSIHFGTHLTITTTQSSKNGTFSAEFRVSPQSPGTKTITAEDTSGNLATTLFYIIPPKLSVSPPSGLVGVEVSVSGSSFFEDSLVAIHFGTHPTITTTTSSDNGTFSTTFIVDTQTPGTKVITASDSEGNLATTLFYLLPPTTLLVSPSFVIVAKNDEFSVDVEIRDVRDMAAVEVFLGFDQNILEVLEIASGTFPSEAVTVQRYDNTEGSIYYFAGLFF